MNQLFRIAIIALAILLALLTIITFANHDFAFFLVIVADALMAFVLVDEFGKKG